MKRFCEKISRFLLDVDNVTEDEIDEVRFGIELILTQMILFFLLLAIGIFRNMVLETIIFIIALVGLRTFVDGYHADSFYRCMFLTTLLYLGTLYFADFENSYLLIMAILIAAKAFMWQENHEARNVKISKLIFLGMSGCDWINLSYRTTTKHDNWFYFIFYRCKYGGEKTWL